MGKSIIKSCTCPSDFQDELYGKKNRVHSVSQDNSKAYCSVCGGSAKKAKRDGIEPKNRKYKLL